MYLGNISSNYIIFFASDFIFKYNFIDLQKYIFILSSFGLLMWEILVRDIPFDDCMSIEEVETKIKNGGTPKIPPKDSHNCTDEYIEIMKNCWQFKLQQRAN